MTFFAFVVVIVVVVERGVFVVNVVAVVSVVVVVFYRRDSCLVSLRTLGHLMFVHYQANTSSEGNEEDSIDKYYQQ